MKTVSDQQVRELATEILSQPEYARFRYRDPEWPAWVRAIIDQIDALLASIGRIYVESPAAYWALVLGLLLISVALFAHVIYSVRRALAMVPPADEAHGVEGYVDLARRADEAAYAGGYLDAARYLQLASIELLVKRGWLELARSEPNPVLRERLAQSALAPELEDAMHDLVDRLEVGQFRDHAAGQALYHDWRQLYGQLNDLEPHVS